MYKNKKVYSRLGQEMCIVIDIALALSGSEAVVESSYSVMGSQTMPSGQSNDTLVGRTNIDWCFPNSTTCSNTSPSVSKWNCRIWIESASHTCFYR